MNYDFIILLFVGGILLVSSIYNLEFFFNSRKVRQINELITRKWSRVLFGGLGIACCIMGVLVLMGKAS